MTSDLPTRTTTKFGATYQKAIPLEDLVTPETVYVPAFADVFPLYHAADQEGWNHDKPGIICRWNGIEINIDREALNL